MLLDVAQTPRRLKLTRRLQTEIPLPQHPDFRVSKIQQTVQFIAVQTKVAPIINWNNNVDEAVPNDRNTLSGHMPTYLQAHYFL